ncbi:MAG: tetratricopeptide repeat protein [Pseudomonadota bacterium]
MLEGLALWLLLPICIILGWALGRNPRTTLSESEALAGLTLAQDNPDRAIAALTKALERDPAAAELNLTLGALFRKRGEIDRALRLHENVLSQPELKPDTRALALYELGQDCVKAGLLDRAEEALRKASQHPAFDVLAYEQLLPLYEQLSEWHKAADVAEQLEKLKRQSYATVRAHYALELAELAQRAGDGGQAQKLAQRALAVDAQCVRANLLMGQLQESAQDWPAALASYARVPTQDSSFLPEAIAAVQRVCAASGDTDALKAFLDALETDHGLDSSVWLSRAELMQDPAMQASYLAEKLALKPSWRGLIHFLSLPAAQDAGVLSAPVQSFRDALEKLIQRRPRYQCRHCGFTPSLLFWRCPSCKQWGMVSPSEDSL